MSAYVTSGKQYRYCLLLFKNYDIAELYYDRVVVVLLQLPLLIHWCTHHKTSRATSNFYDHAVSTVGESKIPWK